MPGENRVDFAPGRGLEQVDSEPPARGGSRVLSDFRSADCNPSSGLCHRRRELDEEIVGGLLRRTVDETLAELG